MVNVIEHKQGRLYQNSRSQGVPIQDKLLFGCPEIIDLTWFFKKIYIATRTTSERDTLVPIFYFIKNPSPTPLFLLFRKSHAASSLFACKRAHDASICYQLFAGAPAARASFLYPVDNEKPDEINGFIGFSFCK
jgi:hypothetical protein